MLRRRAAEVRVVGTSTCEGRLTVDGAASYVNTVVNRSLSSRAW